MSMKVFMTENGRLHPAWLIFSLSFILSHGIPGIIPLLPLVSKVLQVSTSEITLLLSYFTFSALIFTGIWGVLITRLNQSVLLLVALACYFFGGVLCSLVDSVNALIFFRIIQGAGSAGIHLLSVLLTTQYYQGHERAKIMGTSFAVMSVGLFTMPLLSGFMASYSWKFSFIALQLPTLVAVMIFFFTKKISKPVQSKKKHSLNDYKKLFSNPKIIALFFGFFLISGIDITLPHLLSLYTSQKFNFSTSQIGIIYSIGNIGLIIGSGLLMKKLSRLKSFPYIILASGLLISFCIFIILHVNTLYIFALLLFIYYLTSGTIIPFLNYSLSISVPKEILAPAITMFMISLRLGQGIISYLFSYIANMQGYTTAIYTTVSCYILMITLIFYFMFNNSVFETKPE